MLHESLGINYESVKNMRNAARTGHELTDNPRRFDTIREIFSHDSYARDRVIKLRENPSAISSLVLLLGLISPFPTNELRVATNAQNNAKTPPNRLRFSNDIQECLRNSVRITHDFSNRGIRGQSFEQFKTFGPNSW